ncbi:acetolactate synthase, large subunit [Sulfobacillus acidophilus TPY]|uniref:Acetolactate synthase n=1 Tax=Sulfobacillus acidophilus (strain ATCC 700253 / DSM 10332 / NAL) TaxID=679936 RepID=G8TZU6_SULAD|nr:acetolactate synthase, large subunit [Sulfobacillus acidophilus TPY]AEW06426.1 acetolactate synthase, large subunit [Sulfobacillus acidophilus DSM 10332]
MTGAERVWQVLCEFGADTVFGVPGGAVLPLVDAMVQHRDHLDFVVTRHESAAIHAADGYARVKGRPGIALVTSGPGGTNGITGLMTAMTDSVPLVVLVGQVPTTLIGSDAFQETDLFTMALSIVKHSYRIERVDDVYRIVSEAYHLAGAGRPGPVMIELPKDVQLALEEQPVLPEPVPSRPPFRPNPLSVARFRAYLNRARRPVFYVGGGVTASDTAVWVRRLAERYHAPVTTTLMGLGAFPASNPLYLGMLGMHGTWAANHAMQEADLIIALGARFDDRVTGQVASFAPKAKIVHVEVDTAEIRKIVHPDVTFHGDLRDVFPYLDRWIPKARHEEWMQTITRWKTEHPVRVPGAPPGRLSSPQALLKLMEFLDADDVVVTDVGQHQMWAALFIGREKPRRFITSGGAGTMGYGLPAAMGARLAHPAGKVVLVAGDGSLQMNLQELATLAQYQLPVWIVLLNNGGHGMVRQWQDLFHGHRRHGVHLLNPDFVQLAQAFGISGFSVGNDADLVGALTEMSTLDGPALLEVFINENEMVYPMVPAGKPLSEVLEG